ncbi:hypothetical protein [Kushneria phosphatilytica]|uniref:Uncharacterized protein n=1 Tax=Kushneria phosphatilytica TaxID=657387 RepID=A0A1S1NW14_9GAMM|nr:hypothetical protein [Kushneria phosphatilytica]OHV11178.1 hypothetical protein BH688_07580 [Kushneria phosphatilytica]QEL12253.1 hypothetical protein FY550_14650 [Kushneria phosphatilytica]
MYQDTRRLKAHRTGINLDEFEDNLIEALAAYTGVEKATLMREMVMRGAMDMLGVSSVQEFDAVSMIEVQPIAKLH